jgi:hypothetical protein
LAPPVLLAPPVQESVSVAPAALFDVQTVSGVPLQAAKPNATNHPVMKPACRDRFAMKFSTFRRLARSDTQLCATA